MNPYVYLSETAPCADNIAFDGGSFAYRIVLDEWVRLLFGNSHMSIVLIDCFWEKNYGKVY